MPDKKDPSLFGQGAADMGFGAANGIIGGLLGQAFAGMNDRRQIRQQAKLQAMQEQGNMRMMDYQKQKDLEMWNKTNYGAQVQHLKDAGLNPGLLYGMSGGGGVTTGNSGGGVQGGQAPVGGGEAMAGMGMAMQMGLMRAQKENIEAQTEQIRGETLEEGVKTKNVGADTELKGSQKKMQDVLASLEQAKFDDSVGIARNMSNKLEEEWLGLVRENRIGNNVESERVKGEIEEWQGKALENLLTKAMTQTEGTKQQVNREQATVLANQWRQRWREIEIGGMKQTEEQRSGEHSRFINDVSESTKIPVDMVEKIIQAIIVRGALRPGHTPVRGFGK